VTRRLKPFCSFLLFGLIVLVAIPAPLSASQKNDREKAGAVLFRDKGCTYCHGIGGVGTTKAPALTSLYKDKTWTPEKITNQILNGGQKMPPFRDSITDDEVTDLIAYLRAKNKPVPPPAASPDATPASSPQL
jgi:mono/diheme cytochrome c family protein